MTITLTDTGKRYNREWIFRHCSYTFIAGQTYAITGPNGSGKSTLLQVIAGATMHSEGQLHYHNEKKEELTHLSYTQMAIAAPYLELVEEMTAKEMILFHEQFKPLSHSYSAILEEVGLSKALHKQIRYFSSGMKQRLKLALAFFSNCNVLLLDEPTTNLDSEGIALYQSLIQKYTEGRLVIVSSNDPQEYHFCKKIIAISDYKK